MNVNEQMSSSITRKKTNTTHVLKNKKTQSKHDNKRKSVINLSNYQSYTFFRFDILHLQRVDDCKSLSINEIIHLIFKFKIYLKLYTRAY